MARDLRKDLTRKEQFEIASSMHALILDGLYRETGWTARQAVFHGGTALAFAWDSPRFSEDLDFMASEEAVEGLKLIAEKVRDRVGLRMSMFYPGSRVVLAGPKGNEVTRWDFKWEHPEKRDKVLVKAEFLATKAELLSAYKSSHIVPTARGPIGVSILIPVPDLVSAWADKVKAIATRTGFKWRDPFDLAWINRCLKREDELSAEDYLTALAATASLYDKSLDDVAEGLDQVLSSGVMDDVAEFEENMKRWFLEEDAERYTATGYFRKSLGEARRELEKALGMINDLKKGMRP